MRAATEWTKEIDRSLRSGIAIVRNKGTFSILHNLNVHEGVDNMAETKKPKDSRKHETRVSVAGNGLVRSEPLANVPPPFSPLVARVIVEHARARVA